VSVKGFEYDGAAKIGTGKHSIDSIRTIIVVHTEIGQKGLAQNKLMVSMSNNENMMAGLHSANVQLHVVANSVKIHVMPGLWLL
jgi:hypothetical protein